MYQACYGPVINYRYGEDIILCNSFVPHPSNDYEELTVRTLRVLNLLAEDVRNTHSQHTQHRQYTRSLEVGIRFSDDIDLGLECEIHVQ